MVWWRFRPYPYYLVEDDAVHFHQVMKTCDKHNINYYTEFKKPAILISSIATEMKLELVASSTTIQKDKICLGKAIGFPNIGTAF